MSRGKYQNFLEKTELSYDDLLTLAAAKKIKGVFGGLVLIRHAGEDYLKITNPESFKHLLEQEVQK